MPSLYAIQSHLVNDYIENRDRRVVEQELSLCDHHIQRLSPRKKHLELELLILQAEFNLWAARRNACQHALKEVNRLESSPRLLRKRTTPPTRVDTVVSNLEKMSTTDRAALLLQLEDLLKGE